MIAHDRVFGILSLWYEIGLEGVSGSAHVRPRLWCEAEFEGV